MSLTLDDILKFRWVKMHSSPTENQARATKLVTLVVRFGGRKVKGL